MLKQNTSKRASDTRGASDTTSSRRGRSLTRTLLTLTAGIALLAVFAWALPRLSAAVSVTEIHDAEPAASSKTSPAAPASIVLVTNQAALNANDSVMWNGLGMDGDTVPTTFSATSTLGKTIGGNLAGSAGSGLVCDPNVAGACIRYEFGDFTLWTTPDGGPLTLTFPAVSGVGTFLVNSANPGTQFTASLAVYNGATLLGTVTETSDEAGSPIYLGATDTTGANITSAVYSLTLAGQIQGPIVSYTYKSYDCSGGHVDMPFCSSLSLALCPVGPNRLQCPQKCLCGSSPAASLPFTTTSTTTYPNITRSPNYGPSTPDTNPSNLADFYIASVDFAGASTAPPINGAVCSNFTNKTTANGLGNNAVNGVYAVGSTVYAATFNGLSISTNGGATFTNKLSGINVFSVYALGSTVYAGTQNNGLWISTDDGANFTQKTTAHGLGNNTVNSVYAVGSTVYAATEGGGLSITTDGGASFTNRTTAHGLGSNQIRSVYAVGNTVYAAAYFGGVSISTNGGTSFTNHTTGLCDNAVNGVFAQGNTVYAATFSCLAISTDGGANFTSKTTADGLGDDWATSVYALGNTVYVATRGGGGGLAISTNGGNSFTNYTSGLGSSGDTRSAFATSASVYAGTGGGLSFCPPVATTPEINLLGNSTTIASGDTTPSLADHTDFGTTSVASGTVARTFTIENTGVGALNLTGIPIVALSGTNAADFSVTTQPTSPVAGSGSTTFVVTFDPSAAGTRTATVSIANDDADENPYTFAIQGGGCDGAPVVQNTNDSGAGSLRQAIADACAGSTITFASPLFDTAQTITLASTLTIDKNLTIDGPGPNLLSISGNNAVRVIQISGPPNSVTIRDLTVTQGNTASPGGGISTPWTLELINCVISGNKGISGGGLNVATALTLTNSTVSGNMATAGAGGGLQAPVMTITGSTISGNMATDIGGGIKANGPVSITGSTISGNTSLGNGGGINLTSSGHTITNSTISGNTANFGGGVFTNGSVTVSSCTITDNTATGSPGGGGFFANGPTTLKNTLIAGNHHADNPDIFIGSNIASQGYNLIGNADNGAGPVTAATGDQFGTTGSPINAMLGPLASNGGPTQTHALLPGSPAIDKGSAFTLTTDQRGLNRTYDIGGITNAADGTDIGALEQTAPEINLTGNGMTIASGDATPSLADHTDFTTTSVASGTVMYTYTIENTGTADLNLTGSPRVALSGTNAADFSVTTQPISPVAPSSSTTFIITFDPSALGLRTATVSIANDDADENPYTFAIQGTGSAPEINVKGNSTTIASGDTTPSTTDDTDFGTVSAASGTVAKTFTIENLGNLALNLTGTPIVSLSGTNAADFSVTTQPAASVVAPTGTRTFVVTFDPNAPGTRSATVSIANDDADENPYTFAIQGSGCDGAPVVTSIADSGAGSLRQAIADACPGSTITFASPLFDSAQTITLTSGQLVLDKNLTIQGTGANLLSISGNNASRVFYIASSVTAGLSGMTITGGNGVGALPSGKNGSGGGIWNDGALTVTNSVITGNAAQDYGGGIEVYSSNGSLTLIASTVSNNSTTNGLGGGIEHDRGTLVVTNSTISGNHSNTSNGYSAGGIYSSGASATITASTITGNTAVGTNGAGGLRNDGATLVTVRNSIIAGNTGTNGATADVNGVSGGAFTSQGYNLIGDGTGGSGFTGTADQVGTTANPINALLGALASNGGPTQTHAPLPGSPAIDKGNAFTLTTDQHGQTRPKDNPSITPASGGDDSDIGAFEAQNAPPTISSDTITVKAGSSAVSFTIATAADPDQAASTLGITINGSPTTATVNGVTVSGVTINANGSVTANVVPTCAATTATFNLVVTDNQSVTGNGMLTVTVTPNMPPVLSYGNQAFPPGSTPSFGPAVTSDNGSIANFALMSITPASGLSLTVNPATGQVQVTNATVAQTFTVVIRATDNCGLVTDATFTVALPCPTITFGPASLTNAAINTAYPQTITASPAGNYSFAVTGGLLPAGLTLNSDGSFSGAATQSGTFNFRVTATGFGACSGFRDYALTVSCPGISITTGSLPGGTIGTAYSQAISASPAGSYSFSVSSGVLPPGLTLNAATGAITGTPAVSGSFNFTITASAGGCAASQSYTVAIACATISLSPAALPPGQAGMAYSQMISVTPAGSYTFTLVTGSLPSGLTLNATTGVISGTPAGIGTFTLTLKAQAANGCNATQNYTLIINCPSVMLSPASLPAGTVGTAYSQTTAASPAGGTYSYAVTSGALPAGLNLNSSSGILSGTPSASGSFSFTVTATGWGGCTGNRAYTVTIGGGGCASITLPATLPNGSVGQLYNAAAAASPAGFYTYSVTGGLPSGVTLFAANGLLFGFPTAAGSYTFTVTATQGACSGSKSYTLLIGAGSLQLASVNDFGGDRRSDFTLWRAAQTQWLIVDSATNAARTTQWGQAGDLAVTGDYDGDGKADLAAFGKDGHWRVKLSGDGATLDKVWGLGSDMAVPGDYDGDGKTDLAVWRGAESGWYIQRSSDGQTQSVQWGTSLAPYLDIPVPGDYDGDGRTDIAVFRQANGYWYIRRSSDGRTVDKAWGLGTDVPVPGDYDGDGQTDIAVWRGSEGDWYIVRSSDGAVESKFWGAAFAPYFDVPAVGDYDGDGKTDVAVWRNSDAHWYVQYSSDGATRVVTQGRSGDQPVTATPRR